MNPKFYADFTVNSHDTDKNGNVRPSVMLRYLHEAANLQFESTHPTLDELRYEHHKAFLLSRAALSVKRQLRSFEKITAVTWAGGGKAASFYRCGEIRVQDETVATLVSLWALVDLTAGKLCRVKDTALPVPSLEEYPLEIPSHIRFSPEIALTERGIRVVCNSDIDINGHMNNTNYPDMLADYIPNIENSRVRDFSIGYIHEAKLGEVLRVFCGEWEGKHYVRTLRADGSVNAEGVFTLEALS